MSTIKTTCGNCGDIKLTVDDVELEDSRGSQSKYWFSCPSCKESQSRPASERVVSALLGIGCRVRETKKFTEDDIEEFIILLNREDIHIVELAENEGG